MSQYFQEDDNYQGQLDFQLWKRIAQHALPYRRPLFGLCFFGMLLAGIEIAFPLVTAGLIDEAISNGVTDVLWWYIAAYAVLCAGFAVFVWTFIVFAGRAATGIAYDLRTKGFQRLQELSFSYFDMRPVGWLLTRLTSDCTKLSSLIPWFMLDIVWGTFMVCGITIAMLVLNWKLGIVVLLIVPPLAAVSWIFQKKLLESSRLVRKTNSQMTASYNEAIMGVRTTKALVREEANLREFQKQSSDMFTYSMRNALQSAVYLPLVLTFGALGSGLALWRGGILVESDGLSAGTLIAFMQYAVLFYQPIQELAERFTQLQAAQAAAERVQSLLDEVPAVRDSDDVIARQTADERRSDVIESIEFRDVNFWYKPGEHVLREFNLSVEPGETIALVGATGGGKSTIVNLVARFYEPNEGEVCINGIDYRQLPLAWLQSKLGVVLQTPHLFSGTIRDNIRYGRLEASDAEVIDAATTACAHEFISELADGYDSEVGEGGGNLSTGQRQLISLARAVLSDPQIFIMDEATSSVDTESERLIQVGIDRVLNNRIAFVIAHRLSTIRSADRILVIDAGCIVEEGSHDELMKIRGRYFNLYTRQFAHDHEADAFIG